MVKHACFISYRHPPPTAHHEHFRSRFVSEFRRVLEQYLTVDVRPYDDSELRRQPGIDYPRTLAEALCRSACLVAILVPDYLESGWTVGEWRAMERLEQARLGRTQLIIPVIVRGDPRALQPFIGPRQYFDFSDVVKWTQLHNVRNLRKIEHIARTIDQHVKRLSALTIECEAFEIDTTIDPGVSLVADPDPFAP